MYQRAAVIGLGLIGSSIARGLREFQLAKEVVASDKNPISLEYATQKHIIDKALSPEEAVAQASVIVLAVPPSQLGEITRIISPHVRAGTLVTDTASVKHMAAEAIRESLPAGAVYVPSHPIAGSQHSGVKAGRGDLFAGKRVVMTPQTPEDAGIEEISRLWQGLGAQVEYMPAAIHDKIYAYVSHLPQLLAFAAADVLAPYMAQHHSERFARFTRLCGSDEGLWEDIFAANLGYIEEALARYMALFHSMREELATGAAASGTTQTPDIQCFTELLPVVLASTLVGTIYQEERALGLHFNRYGGTGFKDFTAPLEGEPNKPLEDISNKAHAMVQVLDAFTFALSQRIVIKA